MEGTVPQNGNEPRETDFTTRIVGAREVNKINVEQHVGKKVAIENVKMMEGQYGPFFRVETAVVEEIEGQDGKIYLRGSRLFSANKDEADNVWWPQDGNLDTFLKKHKVTTPLELVGKEVVLQTTTSKKDGREYLSFN